MSGLGDNGAALINAISQKTGCTVNAFSSLCYGGLPGGLPGALGDNPGPDVSTQGERHCRIIVCWFSHH